MFFDRSELDDVRSFYRAVPDADPTPLHRLPGLARELGCADVLVKDESARFGLPAFKVVGARYAVARLLESGHVGDVACASTGNHGRAVARAAAAAGCRAHVYVPRAAAAARVAAIRAEGARVIVADSTYDEAVRQMAADASREGWTIVSDTGWDGYETIPRRIMAGYTWIMEEASAEWGSTAPDAIVVQAGVGGLAGAVAGWLEAAFGARRPALVVVEPEGANCVGASLAAGRRTRLFAPPPTSMAGLSCGEVSSVAWPMLRLMVDAAITVSDADTAHATRVLRDQIGEDPAIAAGPSGAAGLAGVLRLLRAPELSGTRERLGLAGPVRVLLFVTEGPTGGPDLRTNQR